MNPPPKPPKSPKPLPRAIPPCPPPPVICNDEDDAPPPPSDDEDDLPPPSDDDEDSPPSIKPNSYHGKDQVGQSSPIIKPPAPQTITRPIQPPPPPPPPRPEASPSSSGSTMRPPPPPGPPPVLSSSTSPPNSTANTNSDVTPRSFSISPFRRASNQTTDRPESATTTTTSASSICVDPEEEILRACGVYMVYEDAIKRNILNKMNRDGKFEKNIFILTPRELIYIKVPAIKPKTVASAVATLKGASADVAAAAAPPPPEPNRILPLNTLLAMPLGEGDTPGKAEKRERTFKIFAKEKSFFVRAPTVQLKEDWLEAIREATSVNKRLSLAQQDVEKMAPIFVSSESACQNCAKIFTFFVRKNHCHNCGKCVCEMCSREKMRIPKLDEKKLFRVCNPCGKELKSVRVYGTHRYTPITTVEGEEKVEES